MAHTPRGLYSSALNHTNHERDHAGMTSADLMKKVWVRYKSNTSKNSHQSPDFHFCMNRVNHDGSPIENPYHGSDPYHSNATAANLSCTQGGVARRPQSAPQGGRSGGDTARERRGGGYPSASPDKRPATAPAEKPRLRPGAQAELRGYGKRADVPEWPRDWARTGGSGHAYATCGVGEHVTRFKTAPPPRSEASSVVSPGAGRGSRPPREGGGGDPRSPNSNRQPRDANPRSSNKRR